MAKDGVVDEERGNQRKTEGGNEGETHSCSRSYIKAEAVFFSSLTGRLTLFPHRLSKLH